MNKKIVLITGILLFIAVVAIISLPAIVSSSKENKAIEALNAMYDEDFTMAKSTAGEVFFGGAYKITVQSLNTDNVYDFLVDGETYTGNYYGENVNIELNEFLAPHVDGLVMSNTHIEATEAITYKEAGIEKLRVGFLTNKALTEEKVKELATLLKAELGEIPIEFENIVIEKQEIYEGAKNEVVLFFPLSGVTEKYFEEVPLSTKKYQF